MVLLRESGMTQPAIADAMGVSLSTVNRAHMAYDHGGLKALRRKPSGGPKRENILHRTQPNTRQIHHLVPLHSQVTLIWKWY
jgi:transposase